jgi:hypothetical protein
MSDNTARVAVEAALPDFADLKSAVTRQIARFSAREMYRTSVAGDALWDCYLGSFPEGSDPFFRTRTHHNCSCCRHFIRTLGAVVSIIDGEVVSLWDLEGLKEPAYQQVAAALSALVKSHPLENRFLYDQEFVGTDKNFQDTEGGVLTWNHLYAALPRRNNSSVVMRAKSIGPALADFRASYDVLWRGLTELKPDAVATVLDLISRNALYRGEEHLSALKGFQHVQTAFNALAETGPARSVFVWQKAGNISGPVARFRNTSIGGLVTDLSDGMDLERAVRQFEFKVAPENYRRPTALVTTAMVKRAEEEIASLGLTSALERRFATLADVSVNNVLYADRSARRVMKPSVFEQIAATTPLKATAFDGVQEVKAEDFIQHILPGASMLEIMVENRHATNLVSLIAPADPGAASLFTWDNRFSWSYVGDFADAIKERVRKAGGNVTGDVCCRLAWNNYDDLDLHMWEPGNYHIYYRNKGERSPNGGMLDVDANAGGGGPGHGTREPVENIFYTDQGTMRPGAYRLVVHQFAKVESRDVGFEVQIDVGGEVTSFVHPKDLGHKKDVEIASVYLDKKDGKTTIKVIPVLPVATSSVLSQKLWGIDTNTFSRVNVVCLSPNHWDGAVGNRHFFFMLAGCKNDGSARGFYNEFLSPKLAEHRKVLELVGAKMRAEESPEQLSGVGFSTTQRNSVVARVTGATATQRTLRVTF